MLNGRRVLFSDCYPSQCSSRRIYASLDEVRLFSLFVLVQTLMFLRGPPPIPPLPPPPRLTTEASTNSGSSASSSRPPGLLEAIRGHNGVKGLKKTSPGVGSPSNKEGSFEDDLRARLAQRREAFGGEDLGSLSNLIPVDSDLREDSAGFDDR